MKKIITLACSVLLSSFVFAEIFGPRIFEVEFGVPASISNNAFMLDDIMQDEAVLDLGQMADNLPKSGFTVLSEAAVNGAIRVNVAGVNAGLIAGLDVYENFNLSKAFFDFLGKGNELGEEMDFGMNFNADVFARAGAEVGFKVGDYKLKIKPTFFVPLFHIVTEDSGITMNNTKEGDLIVKFNANAKMYSFSNFNIDDKLGMPDSGYGFDMGAEFVIPVLEDLDITGSFRMPIIPGHLNYVSSFTMETTMETRILDLASTKMDMKPEITKGAFDEVFYAVNRPFKLDALADYTPLGDFIHFLGGVGFGVRNPFVKSEKSIWYPEYYFGCEVKAGGLASCTLSTEFTDQMFKHSIIGVLNLRVFELDLGVSAASSNLGSSFRGAGMAGYFVTKWGF